MLRGGAQSPLVSINGGKESHPRPSAPAPQHSSARNGMATSHTELPTDCPSLGGTTSNRGESQDVTRREIPSWSLTQKMWGPGGRVKGARLTCPTRLAGG